MTVGGVACRASLEQAARRGELHHGTVALTAPIPSGGGELLAENRAEKIRAFGATVSDNGSVLFIGVSNGTGRKNGLLLLPQPAARA